MYKKSEFKEMLLGQSEIVESSGALLKKSTIFSLSFITDFNKVVVEKGRKNMKILLNPQVPVNFNIFNDIVQTLNSRKLTDDPFGKILNVGDSFEELKSLSLLDNEGYVNISHQKGKVLVLQFWGLWAPPSVQEVIVTHKLLKDNESKWGGNVACVSIAFNDSKENINKVINEMGLKEKLNFYIAHPRREDLNILNYGLDLGPKTVVVDKWGKIRFMGQGLTINLEELLNRCFEETQETNFTKENFKSLKEFFNKTFINTFADQRANFLEFNLFFVKSSIYDFKGQKISSHFVSPKIVCTYKSKCQTNAQKVLDQIFQVVPENLCEVTKHISNLKQAKAETSVHVLNALSSCGLNKTVKLISTTSFLLNPQNDFLLWGIKKAQYEPISLPATSLNEANNFNHVLYQGLNSIKTIESASLLRTCCAVASAKVGDQYVSIDATTTTNSKKSIIYSGDTVMALMFWASWCQHSQPAIENMNSVFAKCKDSWGPQVKGIIVSIDPDASIWKQHIESKKLNDLEHYRLEKDSLSFSVYGIQTVPLLILVNQKGEIVFKGNPNAIKLEESINNLVNKPHETKSIETHEKIISKQEYKSLKGFFKKPEFQNFLKEKYICNPCYFKPTLSVILSKVMELNTQSQPKIFYKAIFTMTIFQQDFIHWKQFTDQIVDIMSPEKFETFQIRLLEETKK